MAVQLNHTIVHSRNAAEASRFVSEILGLPAPTRFAHFHVVQTANGVSLDFLDADDGELARQHYAFLVGDAEFDSIMERIKKRGLKFWADHMGRHEGQINNHDGGKGAYFQDPSGHYLEIITRPYGSGTK